jgi:hypothetical protein
MRLFRKHVPAVFASEDETRAARRQLAPPTEHWHVRYVSFRQELAYQTLSIASVSLKASLKNDLEHRLRGTRRPRSNHHVIKIGGDASVDLKEPVPRLQSLLQLSYAWVGVKRGDADLSHGVLAAAWAEESPETVRALCARAAAEVEDLSQNGLDIGGVHHTFEFWLYGDLKWQRHAMGLAGSTHFCHICHCTAAEAKKGVLDTTHWHLINVFDTAGSGIEPDSRQPRTLQQIRHWATVRYEQLRLEWTAAAAAAAESKAGPEPTDERSDGDDVDDGSGSDSDSDLATHTDPPAHAHPNATLLMTAQPTAVPTGLDNGPIIGSIYLVA